MLNLYERRREVGTYASNIRVMHDLEPLSAFFRASRAAKEFVGQMGWKSVGRWTDGAFVKRRGRQSVPVLEVKGYPTLKGMSPSGVSFVDRTGVERP